MTDAIAVGNLLGDLAFLILEAHHKSGAPLDKKIVELLHVIEMLRDKAVETVK